MTQVQIISSNLVKPTKNNVQKSTKPRVELTPWDLQFTSTGSTQCGLLYHKPMLPINNIIHHLKISLARTLEIFTPLAGRLRMIKNDNDTTSFFIDCNDEGALFIHAKADHVTVNDIDTPVVPDVLHSFFHFLVKYCYQGTNRPLLAVKVTELADGLFIACTVNTFVLDAEALWRFFKSWSQISQGFDRISNFPIIDRWFLDDVKTPMRVPFNPDQHNAHTYYPTWKQTYFHFTKENIGTLKAKANAEMGTTTISSLQALLAHLWRGVVKCRRLDDDHEVNYILVINDRKRLKPSISEDYFGNVVRCERITTTAGMILTAGLGWVAWQLKTCVLGQTDKIVREYLKNWENNPLLSFKDDDLITNNAPTFGVYDKDFGWGKPVLARAGPEERSDGTIHVTCGAEEGSIDLSIVLLPETMDALCGDDEFMKAVTDRPKVRVADTNRVFAKSAL